MSDSASQVLANVIAVTGCDGAGKSTLTNDLCRLLAHEFNPQLIYLGQDSGNILRAILRIPLLGRIVGRLLVRKSERTHDKADKSTSPDMLESLVIYALSRWRRRKHRLMLKQQREGTVIVADRYPQAEVAGFYFDGPGLILGDDAGVVKRWFAAKERRLYQDMARYIPALVIRLNIDAETAYARKPDHRLDMLRDKVRMIPAITFNGAMVLELDAREPYEDVLAAALAGVRNILNATGTDP